jgi:hypothetical protein
MSYSILLQEEAILKAAKSLRNMRKNRKGLVFVFWNLLKEPTMN